MGAHWRVPAGLHTASARLPVEGELPSFAGATGWLNSEPLTPAGLRGKVVIADFWTYTCINWLRQLPYLRAWAGKYSAHGLVVIGVHTPEFSFEHDLDNVRRAIEDMGITYPVATDNDYAVWQGFRQPLLARALLRRRTGPYPSSPLRRRRVRPVRNGHPATAGRERICWRRHRDGLARCPRPGSPGRLGHPEIIRKLHRLRAHRELRLPRRRCARQAARLYHPRAAGTQRLGPVRGLDHGGRGHHAERG